MTENMKLFIAKNKQVLIVFSELLTPELKPIKTAEDLDRSDRAVYRFEDGTVFILSAEDKAGIEYQPRWVGLGN